ncbi:MAG: carboxypeptidase regulatory-like domain-containing protein [Proteobacteria bacterium]|nr:carboxypeptidase regulatory-like domain-containing protein [Pseudomonadota bacterium]
MEPILKAESRSGGRLPPSVSGSEKNVFLEKLKLAKADALLRDTSEYDKWTNLCQRDDTLAVKLAVIILNRYELLEQSKKGQDVDWGLFDNLTRELGKNNINLPESSEILSVNAGSAQNSNTEKPEAPFNTPAISPDVPENTVMTTSETRTENISDTENKKPVFSDDNFVLVNVEYKRYLLGENLTGYTDGNKLYLSLDEIVRALDFSIYSDAANGIANGWFISQDRTFALDLGKKEVLTDGKKMDIPPQGVDVQNDGIFVDSDLLSKWFPVDFKFDFSKQSVGVNPREKLPFELRLEREQSWKNINRPSDSETIYPRKYTDYKLVGQQFVDIGSSSAYKLNSESSDKSDSRFYIHSRGDLGKMSSELYLAYDELDQFDNSTFTFERKDPDKNLLGPLNATSISAGDINPAGLSFVDGNEKERGLRINNKALYRSKDFDTTFFEGTLSPEWDIELYRNNSLINTTRVGSNGKYRFDGIPIYYGINDFKLVFYGPQGQKRTETKRIDVGGDLLKKGAGEYDISFTQKDSHLYESENMNQTRDKGSDKLNLTYDYGLNSHVTLGAGLSKQEVSEEEHNFLNLSARGNYKRIYLKGDYLNDDKSGDAFSLGAQTRVGDINLNMSQNFYNDFLNSEYSQTNLMAATNLTGFSILPNLYTYLSYQNTSGDTYNDERLGGNIAANNSYFHINNYLEWRKTTDSTGASDDSEIVDGNLQTSVHGKKTQLGGRLDYEVSPDPDIISAQISTSYNITDRLSSILSYSRNFKGDTSYDASAGLNYNFNNGKFILSPKMSYNKEGELIAWLTFATSIGVDPFTDKLKVSSTAMDDYGKAMIKVFNDKNNNGVFDQEDEWIEGTKVKSIQSHGQAKTDETGKAYFPLLRQYRPTDIVVDRTSLEDPFWEPREAGFSIIPRPGSIQQFEIPVISTGEIDGTIYTELKDGTEKPYSNANVQLLDEDGNVVRDTKSEYDGFYLFTKVPPGNYTVRIDPEELQKRGMEAPTLAEMEIVPDGNILSGNDIRLMALAKESVPEGEKLAFFEEDDFDLAALDKAVDSVLTGDKAAIALPAKQPPEITEDKQIPLAPGKAEMDLASLEKTVDAVLAGDQKAIDQLEKQPPEGREVKHIPVMAEKTKELPSLPIGGKEKKGVAAFDDLVAKMLKDDQESHPIIPEIESEKAFYPRKAERPAKGLPEKKERVGPADDLVAKMLMADLASPPVIPDIGVEKTQDAEYALHAGKGAAPVGGLPDRKEEIGPDIYEKALAKAAPGSQEKTKPLSEKPATRLEIYKNGEWLYPERKKADFLPKEKFGLHLSSYRTAEKAIEGIKYLRDKYKGILDHSDFTVKKVHVSDEKGIWYRVFAGSFDDENKAKKLHRQILMAKPYCRVLPIGKPMDSISGSMTGVHLTSFRTTRKAEMSIEELKAQYPSILKDAEFSIVSVDLGPEMGKWKRVIAGRFSNAEEAKALAKRIKMKSPYGKVMQIEEDTDLGVHLASCKTAEMAAVELKRLQGKYRSILNDDDFSIRRVYLGKEKGVWYRIFAGRFKDQQAATSIKASLNHSNQYARILKLSRK